MAKAIDGVSSTTVPQERGNYGDVIVKDSARAHFGNNYYLSRTTPRRDNYHALYRSLTFDGMGTRVRNVEMGLHQTCDWLLQHDDFILWTDQSRVQEHLGLLWIKGKPGCGKSTLMKAAFDWAQKEWQDSIVLAYFFDARAPSDLEKSCLGLYRSIVYELLSRYKGIRPVFQRVFSPKETDGRVQEWTEVELKNFLLNLIKDGYLPQLNIFVDALDEGSDNDVRRMLVFFENVATCSIEVGTIFRLCLSSRHYPQIDVRSSLSIVVEAQQGHKNDINLYIEKTLPQKPSKSMAGIKAALLQKADGVFLWLVLCISLVKPLLDRGRINAVRKRLDEIPSDLYDLFLAIMASSSDDIDKCLILFRWMMFPQRALYPYELYSAIMYRVDTEIYNGVGENDHAMVYNYILHCSRGLVEITQGPMPRVQFIHGTVRQFLTEVHEFGGMPQCSWVIPCDFQRDVCHLTVAEICLDYLVNVHDPRDSMVHPVAFYAAKYWWQHLQQIKNVSCDKVLDLAVDLLAGDRDRLVAWLQLYDVDTDTNFRDLASPLYYASCIGVPEIVARLVALGGDVNIRGGNEGAPLCAASMRGHEKVVQILLDEGADINTQGGLCGTKLSVALDQCPEMILQTVLDEGTETNYLGDNGTALYVASRAGDDTLVRLLLEYGADVNVTTGYWSNALNAAARAGHQGIVQMLLKKGAVINAGRFSITTALSIASGLGFEAIVRLLLDCGADANDLDQLNGSALWAASVSGHERIVQLLLERGADVNSPGEVSQTTPLYDASRHGHVEVVRMLLEYGADVNGADVDFEDHWGCTALDIARSNGHSDVVKMLLQWGGGQKRSSGKSWSFK